MKGRKPKPFLVQELEGETGKRAPVAKIEPSGGDFDPAFPLGQIAKAEWDRIRAEAPWIRASSALLLSERCQAAEDLIAAHQDVKKRGKLLTTRNGKVKNPSLQIIREARAFLARVDPEFGLTSCSESKVNARQKPKLDPLEAALCG